MSFLQAQAAPAPPWDRSQRRHARRPLTDKLAEELQRLVEDRDAFGVDPSIDPDLDPSAALLLRVEPARPALEAREGVGGRGRTERLLALRAAALSVGSESHLNFSKNPAADSRPPALSSDLRLNACSSASAPRAGDANDTQPLPVGRGATNPRGV